MSRAVLTAILAALLWLGAGAASADTSGTDFLDGSTNALIMSPTGFSDPEDFKGYMPSIDKLYLEQLGFPANGTLTQLTTPETPFFGPSIAKGDAILVNAIETAWKNGEFNAEHPLTVVGYSQSTVIESQVEPILKAAGIPTEWLRFVMLGDAGSAPSTGATGILDSELGIIVDDFLGWTNLNGTETPTNDYPAVVFDIPHGFWEDTTADKTLGQLIFGNVLHGDYLGFSQATIEAAINDTATTNVNGLTTYYTIPDPVGMAAIEVPLQTILNNLFG